MGRESGPVMPLEQRCVEPGHWLIEGYDVKRVKYGWPQGWWWRIALPGGVLAEVQRRTLGEIREWIREQS
jgi:hypothetical protein